MWQSHALHVGVNIAPGGALRFHWGPRGAASRTPQRQCSCGRRRLDRKINSDLDFDLDIFAHWKGCAAVGAYDARNAQEDACRRA